MNYDGKKILDLEITDSDADVSTVREYLKAILVALFEEGEGFTGKRPLGFNGWRFDLGKALARGGYMPEGMTDARSILAGEDGRTYGAYMEAVEEAMKAAIEEM